MIVNFDSAAETPRRTQNVTGTARCKHYSQSQHALSALIRTLLHATHAALQNIRNNTEADQQRMITNHLDDLDLGVDAKGVQECLQVFLHLYAVVIDFCTRPTALS